MSRDSSSAASNSDSLKSWLLIAVVAGGLALIASLVQWSRLNDLEQQLANLDVDHIRAKRLTIVDDSEAPRIELGIHKGTEAQIILKNDKGVQAIMRGLESGAGIIATFERGRLRTSMESDSGGGKVKAFSNTHLFGLLQPRYESFERESLIANVPLLTDSSESYALWLPKNYGDGLTTPLQPRPILFLLNALGDGPKIIEPFLEAARERGWILAASNSYRGGMINPSATIRRFISDVESRVALERGRLYIGGFSWGGFNAAWAAQAYAPKFAGTIAIGTPATGGPGLVPHLNILRGLPRAHHIFLAGKQDSLGKDIRFSFDSLKYGGRHYSVIHPYKEGHVIPPMSACSNALHSLELVYKLGTGPKSQGDHDFIRRELTEWCDHYETLSDLNKVIESPSLQVWQRLQQNIPKDVIDRIKTLDAAQLKLRDNNSLKEDLKHELNYAKALPRNTLDLNELNRSFEALKIVKRECKDRPIEQKVMDTLGLVNELKKTTAAWIAERK